MNFQEHMNLLDNDEKSNTELREKHSSDYYSEMMKKNGFRHVAKYPNYAPVQTSEYLDKISGKHPETPDYESHIRRQNSFVANQNKEESKSKAARSGTKPRYDLITPEFLKSLGETLDNGAKAYG